MDHSVDPERPRGSSAWPFVFLNPASAKMAEEIPQPPVIYEGLDPAEDGDRFGIKKLSGAVKSLSDPLRWGEEAKNRMFGRTFERVDREPVAIFSTPRGKFLERALSAPLPFCKNYFV